MRAEPAPAPPPPPPAVPPIAAAPQVVINMPAMMPQQPAAGPSFGSTFKMVFYVCVSLVILFILFLVGIGFLGGLAQQSGKNP